MKAVEIHEYGAARSVLRLNDNAPTPKPAADEILIENFGTSINPVDCAARSGYGRDFFSQVGWGELPQILGRDASGTVAATGSAVRGFKVGDPVYAAPPIGCYAEYVTVKAEHAARKPAILSHLEAASLPFIALTAWSALVVDVGLTPETAAGRKVAVTRAAGGVGSFAVQLLKAWGAEVAGICSTRNVDFVRQLGADTIVDYDREDFLDRLSGYDLVFDLVGRKSDFDEIDMDYKAGFDAGEGAEYDSQLMSILRPDSDATYVTVCSPKVAFTNRFGFEEGLHRAEQEYEVRAKSAAARGPRYLWSFFKPDGHALREIAALVDAGKIRPVIDRVYPLQDIAAAHEYCESKKAQGKIVVDIKGGLQ